MPTYNRDDSPNPDSPTAQCELICSHVYSGTHWVTIPDQNILWQQILARLASNRKPNTMVVICDEDMRQKFCREYYCLNNIQFLDWKQPYSSRTHTDVFVCLSVVNQKSFRVKLDIQKATRSKSINMSWDRDSGYCDFISINMRIVSNFSPKSIDSDAHIPRTNLTLEKGWKVKYPRVRIPHEDICDTQIVTIEKPYEDVNRARDILQFPDLFDYHAISLQGFCDRYSLNEEQQQDLKSRVDGDCDICGDQYQDDCCLVSCCHQSVCKNCISKIIVDNGNCPYCRHETPEIWKLVDNGNSQYSTLDDLLELVDTNTSSNDHRILHFPISGTPTISDASRDCAKVRKGDRHRVTHILCPLMNSESIKDYRINSGGRENIQVIFYTWKEDPHLSQVSDHNILRNLKDLVFADTKLLPNIEDYREMVSTSAGGSELVNAILWGNLRDYRYVKIVDGLPVWDLYLLADNTQRDLANAGIECVRGTGLAKWAFGDQDETLDVPIIFLCTYGVIVDFFHIQCAMDTRCSQYHLEPEAKIAKMSAFDDLYEDSESEEISFQ